MIVCVHDLDKDITRIRRAEWGARDDGGTRETRRLYVFVRLRVLRALGRLIHGARHAGRALSPELTRRRPGAFNGSTSRRP
jgi:hypothetical protein